MEVVPNIHRIQVPLGDRFVCIFVLVGEDATLVIDTGLKDTPASHLAPYFEVNGLDLEAVRYVVISHADFDHSGGNGELRTLTPDAVFMCHKLDCAMIEDINEMITNRYNAWEKQHAIHGDVATDNWIRDNVSDTPIDITLAGGERIRLSAHWHVDILHTAGHSWGHISVYDCKSKTAIIADAALYNSVLTAEGNPAFPPTYRYLDTYTATIQRLQAMEIDTLLTSHYPVYSGSDVAEFLGESLAYTDQVNQALTNVLANTRKPLTLSEIIMAIHTKIGKWPTGAEAFLNFPLTGHLEQMELYNQVALDERNGVITYAWNG